MLYCLVKTCRILPILGFCFPLMKYQANVHAIQVEDQRKEVLWSVKKASCKIRDVQKKSVHFSYVYLQVLLWALLFTVFTFYDPPFARVFHVLFEVFSFQGHMAIFVGAVHNFEQASFQVSLF